MWGKKKDGADAETKALAELLSLISSLVQLFGPRTDNVGHFRDDCSRIIRDLPFNLQFDDAAKLTANAAVYEMNAASESRDASVIGAPSIWAKFLLKMYAVVLKIDSGTSATEIASSAEYSAFYQMSETIVEIVNKHTMVLLALVENKNAH